MVRKRERILIVDDEDNIRNILHTRLSAEGYTCREAGNSNQALEKLERYPIELVLLDIKMPGRSGAAVLTEIKERFPDTVVIMATALADTRFAVHCIKQGAYDYVTKPFDLEEIVLSVDRALERRRLELEVRDYRGNLEQKVKEQAEKIRDSFFNAITALAYALDAKDKYTSGHSQTVAEIAMSVAREMGVSPEELERIRLAGQVHDIGKIGMKESILNKPGGLSDEELQHVRRHPVISERILGPVVKDKETLKMVRHHHERYDGVGYPDGLKGERIPLGARILALADAYDAMTSDRPYRKAISPEKARAEIERCRGTQLCPEVIDAFLKAGKPATYVI